VDDLDQSFQDIGDELRNQYSIAYIPTNSLLDGKYHRIRIETPDHKGYQVRARRGYFAKAHTNNSSSSSRPHLRSVAVTFQAMCEFYCADLPRYFVVSRSMIASDSVWPRSMAIREPSAENAYVAMRSVVKCVSGR